MSLRLSVVTIFPDYLLPLRQALVGKAIARGLITLDVHDLRQWTTDVHRTVDDAPFGGGPGMVMRPEPWAAALAAVAPDGATLVVPTPAGQPLRQDAAADLAGRAHLVFACGRYEGIDQRVVDAAATRLDVREISIGDYVLAGGEAATLVIAEAVSRLVPGVLGNAASVGQDSFADGLLEGPCYTRPEVWAGRGVPAVLTSGHHGAIAAWRREQSLQRTAARRPDLLRAQPVDRWTAADRRTLTAAGFHLDGPDMAQ